MSSANLLWQVTGSDRDGPLDRDTSAWGISLLLHLVALVVVALIVVPSAVNQKDLTIVVPLDDKDELVEEANDFHYDTEIRPEVGAGDLPDVSARWSEAPTIADESVVPNPELYLESDVGTFVPFETIEDATGAQFNRQLTVRGTVGAGTTGALGAIDRITHEILLMLEQRKVLVIWLFDQSGSLQQQRDQIIKRFDRVYEELGVITSSNAAIKRFKDKPILTSIVAFGKAVTLRTDKPTDDVEELREAISGIELDRSGIELVFTAIQMAANKYKPFRRVDRETGEPLRNVMMIVVSDEVGDDQNLLESAIQTCRRAAIPVHVIGVPAPFGRQETLVKWVDPDPNYDQTPQWGRVIQGPESFMVERIKLHFSQFSEQTTPIDSGFGPYALTRLCYDTGGIYFAVHPNRNTRRRISGAETAVSSAHFSHFFDERIMRKYRPDYISPQEYKRRLASNQARAALVQTAQMSWIQPLEKPRLQFPKRNEADLANQLTQAQKQAALLEPKVQMLYATLKRGERDRESETILRWKAGYDLAMGRVLAAKVRTESYNAMLAQAKRGMKFKNPQNDTWVLRPSDEISVGSQLKKLRDKSKEYLLRVVEDHLDTPWALLAQRELRGPMSWEWQESYTGVNAPPDPTPANPPAQRRPPRDDRRRMIEQPKPRRSPPPL